MRISDYIRAAYPCVAIESYEEARIISAIVQGTNGASVYLVSASGGLRDLKAESVIDPKAGYPQAFAFTAKQNRAILIALDFEAVIKNPGAYRGLKDCFPQLKANQSIIIMIAPSWVLPAHLQKEVPVLPWELPNRSQLEAAVEVITSAVDIPQFNLESILDSASGLTLVEAENAMALSCVRDKALLPSTLQAEKMSQIKRGGLLEVSEPASPDSIGGLGVLRSYITNRIVPNQADPVKRVKGLLLLGMPGTGKSLASRVLGAITGLPIVRMDVGRLKGSLVGQSEQNMRAALMQVDAVAPCILWIDEIEKSVGGHASSAQSDGGSTLGMIGQLLCWMADQTSCCVIATCNDFQKLPAELTRAGRFDKAFFVDLPSLSERVEIAAIHCKRYGLPEGDIDRLIANHTEGYTGAEIEQVCKEIARGAGWREAIAEVKPISRVRHAEMQALREWARDTLVTANTPEANLSGPSRRLEVI